MKAVMITNRIKWRFLAAIMCLVGYGSLADAQNVTISPTSGNLVAAYTGSSEFGFNDGYCSMWKHKQLPLTLTVGDDKDTTSTGQLKVHADNLKYTSDNTKIIQTSTGNCYTILSLPKGYHFTGYKIVLSNNVPINGAGSSHSLSCNQDWLYYETNSTFGQISSFPSVNLGRWTSSNGDTDYTLTRISNKKGDMSNILYFVYRGNNPKGYTYGAYGAIYIKSFEVTFAADGEFTTNIAPTATNSVGVNYVEIPFNSGKIDVGPFTSNKRSDMNKYYFTYTFGNVTDLYAKNVLYEDDCVGADGVVGSKTEGTKKSITAVKYNDKLYYGLKSNTYYVETPISAIDQSNKEVPIGYRITGATVNYTNTSKGFYITYTNAGTTYYLNTDMQFVTDTKTLWEQDSNGYIHSGDIYFYVYSDWYYGTGKNRVYTLSSTSSSYVGGSVKLLLKNNMIYFTYNANNTTYTCYLQGNTDGSVAKLSTNTTKNAITQNKAADPYTLTIYGTDGNTPVSTIANVTSSGSFSLSGLNNDAIKFIISSVDGNDPTALVTVDLTLEPLNPYVENMDVVCKNSTSGEKIIQNFNSDDFKFGGDPFTFYAPESDQGTNYTFTFENLKSKYADNTYGPLTPEIIGNSRYNFVKSAYYIEDNLYSHVDNVANHVYTDKVNVAEAGDKAFTFNNTADLFDANGTTTKRPTSYLLEYPFTLSTYGTKDNGTFEAISMQAGGNKTFYLFVEDETRYNIAPTTATQHRYYAYYKMNVILATKHYDPVLTWVPIYNNTLTYNDTEKKDKNEYMAGVVVTAPYTEGGVTKQGYLTAAQIQEKMQSDVDSKKTNAAGAPQNAPTDMKNVLYVDGGSLYSIVYTAAKTDGDKPEPDGLKALKNTLGDNALIYLPSNNTYNGNNFAYKTVSKTYKACNNIVLTDKQAFFAPYDIQVDAGYYATYKRLFTAENGKVNKATIMLPFTMSLENGKHTNPDGKCTFTVNTMQTSNCLEAESTDIGGAGNVGKDFSTAAHFISSTAAKTDANTPYMVKIEKYESDDNNQSSYIATQYGSNIIATPNHANVSDNEVCTGETATGTVLINGTNKSYSFTNNGTYSGQTLPKTKDGQTLEIFYFGKNYFFLNQNLTTENLYVYPFRSYYISNSAFGAAKLTMLDIVFGENTSTGIETVETAKKEADFAVVTSRGTITAVAKNDANLSIHNLSGQSVANTAIQAGQTLTFNVPAGMYIINGRKVLVK